VSGSAHPRFFVEHDLFGKPVSTFPDHALSHPEWFVHFAVRIAARDADVAQGCVAQSLKLAP
jgi:hypothetical protein